MVIEFLCPNGHKIRCSDDRAGKGARCPKCGVKFYVPGPEDSVPSDSGSWATAPVQASESPGSSSALRGAPKNQMEFLCPNGHRLWAAASLQGRPGQCPHCGERFHIPTQADYRDHAPPGPSPDDSVIDLEEVAALGLGTGSSGAGGRFPPTSGSSSPVKGLPTAERSDTSVRFLVRLVGSLPNGAACRVHTCDGETFVARSFAARLCDDRCLAFSVESEDESLRLLLVPWDSIVRVEIDGLTELPEEFQG